jgi:hypothetical protein
MRRWSCRALLPLAALWLAACAHVPRPPAELPLRLSPASLGRELALQQRMTVTAYGRTQQFDVVIEADAAAVRLAVLAFGHTMARLDWDGRELVETRVRGWPDAVTASVVLRDLQLVHWPLAAIHPALPLGWTLQADAEGREVRLAGRTMIRVRYLAPETAELENFAAGYRLRFGSWRRSS